MSVLKKIVIKDLRGNFKYHIFIGRNILYKLNDDFKKQIKNKNVFLLYDDFFNHINKADNPIFELNKSISELATSLKLFPVKSRDTNKNFKKLQNLIEKMLSYKIDRDSVIITFGGGVIGDIGGFAAAILLRGIKYIQIPTTLLAQVDSSVGGKTGINTKKGKNLVGAFHQPTKVIIDASLINTLPKRELHAGFAEVIKYSLICDKNFFRYLDINYKNILMLKKPFLEDLIYKSCFIKAKIVSQDEKEKGVRALLNLGHTFGHAFESLLNYKSSHLIHGEAVSIGICMAYRLSQKLGLCNNEDVKKVENIITKYKLPNSIKTLDNLKFNYKNVFKTLYADKKVKNGKLTFVLPKGIGNAILKTNIKEKIILDFLKEEINE